MVDICWIQISLLLFLPVTTPFLKIQIEAEEICIPSIVVGELYYGAQKSGKRQANMVRVDRFAEINVILNCDEVTARHYGQIKNQLKENGRLIPENDIWIAAIALQYELTLVTRDKHFDAVADLEVVMW